MRMNNQELKEYVKLAYEMEQEVFLQQEAIKRAEQKLLHLREEIPSPYSPYSRHSGASFLGALASGAKGALCMFGASIGVLCFYGVADFFYSFPSVHICNYSPPLHSISSNRRKRFFQTV